MTFDHIKKLASSLFTSTKEHAPTGKKLLMFFFGRLLVACIVIKDNRLAAALRKHFAN